MCFLEKLFRNLLRRYPPNFFPRSYYTDCDEQESEQERNSFALNEEDFAEGAYNNEESVLFRDAE